MKKPIKIFYSTLSERFYASSQYKIKENVAVITGDKTDVTNDIAEAIIKYGIEFVKVDPPMPEETKQ
jgi:2-keto-3-deoxy-6-phosphogluconate aldolase